jgi:hypothetical protein
MDTIHGFFISDPQQLGRYAYKIDYVNYAPG